MTAFSRIVPGYFLDSYHIIALKNTVDLPMIRKERDVFCLEEETGAPLAGEIKNSAALLAHGAVKGFLKGLPLPTYLLVYQNYPELEILAKQEGWTLLANPASLRIRVAQRAFFEDMVTELDLPLIPGRIHSFEEIHKRPYQYWAETLGPRFVVQLPDIVQGGGKGTFFVRLPGDYQRLQQRLKDNTWRGVRLRRASVRAFVEGDPASMALCLTRQGLLFSRLQRQLMDLPYCRHLSEDGVFCGHVWDERPWPSAIEDDARAMALKMGRHLAAMGYKGIFGVDFVIEKGKNRIYPIEINPRFTGAFPMLSQLHISNGLIPLEAFHILEFLDLPYEIEVEKLNALYWRPLRGSHLLLFSPPRQKKNGMRRLQAGLHECNPHGKSVSRIRGATHFSEIGNERQFIIVDGPPAFSYVADLNDPDGEAPAAGDPHERFCRLLFSYPVLDGKGLLRPHAAQAIDWVHFTLRNSK
ncbi:MAG: ATP-grasp domain-containing protein [Deltaproteobacteria bacterium]|nr:ATP-grasp domain-containing protein [Deltaproteobacteria bacterium]